jgi:nitroreductase
METLVVKKLAQTRVPIHNLLRRRWSPRAFSEQPVEDEKLLSLLEAARWAPSSANEQPWNFIVATKDDHEIYNRLFECLSERNHRWADRAPVIILAVAKLHYDRTGTPNRHAWYDVGQSVAHLTVQATAVGLSVHQLGGFSVEKARELVAIPDGFEPVVILATGYADASDVLPDDFRQREEAPRLRKPLETFVFTDAWGKPSRHISGTTDFSQD